MMFQPTQLGPGMLFMLATVLIAGWTDLRRWRVPNALLAGSAVIAFLLASLSPSGIGWARCLLGAAAGLALFLPFYLMRGMAAGDVKLLAVLGMYAGPVMVLDIALTSALVGGVWAIVLMARRKRARWSGSAAVRGEDGPLSPQAGGIQHLQDMTLTPSRAGKGHVIPYGVVMAIGTMLVLSASIF